MDGDFNDSICVYGAGVLLQHIEALAKETEGVRSGSEDVEFVHRARVASRRVRSAFPLFEDCLPRKRKKDWLKQIKKVTKALGAARDADVQIEALQAFTFETSDKRAQPGLARLMLRLKQRREKLEPKITRSMEQLIESQILEEMTQRLQPLADRQDKVYLYTPALYQHAFDAISSRLDKLLSFEEYVSQPEKVEELHAMRIAAKWLRYTLENLAPLYASGLKSDIQRVRKIQDLLGEVHDCDVWIAFLPCFLDEERERTIDYFGTARAFHRLVGGINLFLENRRTGRAEKYLEFVDNWAAWEAENDWQALRERIQAPFYKSAPAVSEETSVE